MKDAHARAIESRCLDVTTPPDEKPRSYQQLLDESLDQPFSALAASSSRSATVTPAPANAMTPLKADHAAVAACFRACQKLVDASADGAERQPIAEQICLLQKVDAAIEERISYPAACGLPGADAGLIDEADTEHAGAKDLIAHIRSMGPDEDLYDAKLEVLGKSLMRCFPSSRGPA